jgi:cobalt/nickel transport system permease protein
MSGAHGLHLTGVAGNRGSPVHRLDARAKIVGLLSVTFVAVSAPLAAWPAWAACALALAGVAAAGRVPPRELLRRCRAPLALVLALAVTVPFVRGGGWRLDLGPVAVHEAGLAVLAGVAAKAAIGTLSAVLLMATTSLPDVLAALERMRVPRLLVTIAGLTYRYLFLLSEEAARMRAALAARNWRPRNPAAAGAAGRVAAALFLRAHARAERVHLAMLARGFDGTPPAAAARPLGLWDLAFAALLPALLVSVRLAAGAA